MATIGGLLERYRGVGPGFDFLRVGLALIIVAFHSLTVTNHYFAPRSLDDTPIWLFHYALVPMFFALSGFLITASAQRLSLHNFLINRGIRIVPALAVDTLVCALIIGPLFTTVSWRSYFTGHDFFTYFLNMTGWIHYTLPGVFSNFPVAQVNGSLWTVPFELLCYALISLLIVSGMIKRRWFVLIFTSLYLLFCSFVQFSGLMGHVHDGKLLRVLQIGCIEHEAQAVTAFLFGIVMFQNRDRIPYSRVLFYGCAGIMALAALTLRFDQAQIAPLRFIFIPAIVYITIFIGLTPMPLPRHFKTGDYSYGIYLYHQPFLQIMLFLAPAYTLHFRMGWLVTLLAALPFVLGIAWLSWHLVEKPLLTLRKRFSITAQTHMEKAEAASVLQPPELDNGPLAAGTAPN